MSVYDVPHVYSYDKAVRIFTDAASKPWREGSVGAGYGDYALPELRNPKYGVRKEANDDIVFRFHETDVVTWHPNDEFTIYTYPSSTTCVVINKLTPHGHISCRRSDNACTWRVNNNLFPLRGWDTVCFSQDGVPDTTARFVKLRVNRKRMQEVLREVNYHPYMEWYNMMDRVNLGGWNCGPTLSSDEALAMLQRGTLEDYYALATASNDYSPSGIRKYMAERNQSVYDEEFLEFLPGAWTAPAKVGVV